MHRTRHFRNFIGTQKTAYAFLILLAAAAGHLQAQTEGISFTPASLTFPVTVTGKTSSPQSITLTSTGNLPVTFSGFTLTGANPSDFAISANNCGATLASGATCQISITFTPAATGAASATLNVADDANGSPQTASLAGSGSNLVFTLKPTAVVYPVAAVGTSTTPIAITVTNTGLSSATISSISLGGANPTDFKISSKTCGATLAAGASCSASVAFAPTANGIRTANLLFSDTAAGSPQSVPLSGTGESATPSLIFSPTSLVFNPANLAALQVSSISVTNYSASNINFGQTTISGTNPADFVVIYNNCSPLSPGSSCTVSVGFVPSGPGIRTAILLLHDTAAGNPQCVPLTGVGIASNSLLTFLPGALAFASQTVGASSSIQLAITNYGTSGVSFSSFALTGTNASDFVISGNSCPLGAGQLLTQVSCYVTVSFTPAAAGIRVASLSVSDNATGSPQLVSLSGTGVSPNKQLSFSNGTLAFGAQTVGTSSGQGTVYAQSAATAPVSISNIAVSGVNASDFTIYDGTCFPGAVVSPGSQCYVDLIFTPTAPGTRAATLTFSDDAQGTPQSVAIEGVGQSSLQQLSFNYVNVDFGVLDLGSISSQSGVSVSNLGDSTVSFTNVIVAGANSADFSVSADSCLTPTGVGMGAACNVYVTFSPSATGLRTAQLVFTDSATGSPQTIGLSGAGQPLTQTVTFDYPSLVFPAQVLATHSAQSSQDFYNTGDSPVIISSVSITGGNANDFALSVDQCPIGGAGVAPGSSCYVSVVFTPAAAGLRSSTLQFVDSATGSPHNIPLVGVGRPAAVPLTFNPTDIGFNNQNVGSPSAASSLSVVNNGRAPVSQTVAITGANASDFSILTNNCPTTIAVHASCTLSLVFNPAGLGLRIASLQFTVSGVAYTVGLSGIGTTGAKILTAQQLLVDFGPVNVSSTTAQTQIALSNTGTQTVTFSSFTIGGTNPSDFTISNNQCGSTLPVAGTCYIYLTFTPSVAGVRTGSLLITDDAVGSPQTVPLSGIGQTVTKLLNTPPVIAFNVNNIGTTTTQDIYVYNAGTGNVTISGATVTGTNAADFSVSLSSCSGGGSIASPNGYCDFVVSFTPTGVGVRTAALQFTDDAAGSPQSIPINGVGQIALKSLAVPQSVTAALTTVGVTNSDSYLKVFNSGSAVVTISSFTITGVNAADFAISSTNCTSPLAPGNQCYFYINFTPSAMGVRTATLQIFDDATGSPQSISLNGVGQASSKMLALPPPTELPLTTVGVTSQNSFLYVTNVGTATVTLGAVSIVGANAADFALVSNNCTAGLTIVPGSSCYFYVNFTPLLIGTRSATIQITDDAAGGTQSIPLSGVSQGLTRTADVSPSSLVFGTIAVGSTQYDFVTALVNTGSGQITISGTAFTGLNASDFAIDTTDCTAQSQLAPANSCYVYVNFTPSATGPRTASLVITDNATGGSQTVTLSGTGQ